jgi:hypothetical protein
MKSHHHHFRQYSFRENKLKKIGEIKDGKESRKEE